MKKWNKFALFLVLFAVVSPAQGCFWKLFKKKEETKTVKIDIPETPPPFICRPMMVLHYTDGSVAECSNNGCPNGVIRSVKWDQHGKLILCGNQNSGERPTTTTTEKTDNENIMKFLRQLTKQRQELGAVKEEAIKEKEENVNTDDVVQKKSEIPKVPEIVKEGQEIGDTGDDNTYYVNEDEKVKEDKVVKTAPVE